MVEGRTIKSRDDEMARHRTANVKAAFRPRPSQQDLVPKQASDVSASEHSDASSDPPSYVESVTSDTGEGTGDAPQDGADIRQGGEASTEQQPKPQRQTPDGTADVQPSDEERVQATEGVSEHGVDQEEGQRKETEERLKLRLDLNLDIEMTLKAKVKGTVLVTFL